MASAKKSTPSKKPAAKGPSHPAKKGAKPPPKAKPAPKPAAKKAPIAKNTSQGSARPVAKSKPVPTKPEKKAPEKKAATRVVAAPAGKTATPPAAKGKKEAVSAKKPEPPKKVAKAPKPPKPPKPPKAPRPPKVVVPPPKPLAKAQAKAMEKLARQEATKAKAASGHSTKGIPEKGLTAKVKATLAAVEAKATAKKPTKLFFHEIADGTERVIKRGDKTTTSPVPLDIQNRRRGGGSEESPEELVERIERELEHQHIFKRNMLKPQLCTKCGINAVSERFTIDKELGYCEDCAEILHLGETKEARKIDFHPSLMKKDGEAAPEAEAEGDDDEEEEGPAEVVPDIDV